MCMFNCCRVLHNDEDEYVTNEILLQDLVLWHLLLLGQLGLPWGRFSPLFVILLEGNNGRCVYINIHVLVIGGSRGAPPAPPPSPPPPNRTNFFHFRICFRRKVCVGGWRHPQREILDPPLLVYYALKSSISPQVFVIGFIVSLVRKRRSQVEGSVDRDDFESDDENLLNA